MADVGATCSIRNCRYLERVAVTEQQGLPHSPDRGRCGGRKESDVAHGPTLGVAALIRPPASTCSSSDCSEESRGRPVGRLLDFGPNQPRSRRDDAPGRPPTLFVRESCHELSTCGTGLRGTAAACAIPARDARRRRRRGFCSLRCRASTEWTAAVLVTTFACRVKPENEAELQVSLSNLMDRTRWLPGCLGCWLVAATDDSRSLTLIHEWTDRKALDRFLQSGEHRVLKGMRFLMDEEPRMSVDTVVTRAITRARNPPSPRP